MTTTANVLTSPAPVTPIREAYLRLKDEISQVREADLITINVDVQGIITSMRGRMGQIMAFRDRLATDLPTIDPASFDKLEDYTLATAYTHGQYRATSMPSESFQAVLLEAIEYRGILLADASALHQRGIIDGSKLGDLKGANGYKSTAFDLLTLYTLLRESWDRITGRTALTLDELERAGIVADELMLAAGIRESGPQMMTTVILNRQRAFTLFAQSYDQVRRCIQFMRWNEGDADDIAPSLYAGRRRKSGSELNPEEPAPAEATPAPAVVPTAKVADKVENHVAPGLPGANPFGS